MGAEYEDTWALSPDRKSCPDPQPEVEQEEHSDTCTAKVEEGLWWQPGDPTSQYDSVLHLDGSKGPGPRLGPTPGPGQGPGPGLKHIVQRHEQLHH